MHNILKNAVFSYAITENVEAEFAQHLPLAENLVLNYTEATEVKWAENDSKTHRVVVLGLCIDAHGELTREQIPDFLMKSSEQGGLSQAWTAANRCAGKFLIYLQCPAGSFIWGDATCALGIYYTHSSAVPAVAVSENLAAYYGKITGNKLNDGKIADGKIRAKQELDIEITKNAPLGQPLPADRSSYKKVRILLPNHALDLNTYRAQRLSLPAVKPVSDIEDIAAISERLIANIYREYAKYYQLTCPLTAGYDSRMNFAFAQKMDGDIPYYTFKHPGFSEQTPDLQIAQRLCAAYGREHQVVADLQMPPAEQEKYRALIGRDCSEYALHLAYTYKQAFGARALLNGNNIDQIGKSVTGNSIPLPLIGPHFLRARIYNSGRAALAILKEYLAQIPGAERKYLADLVAWENDCCRWAGQSEITYGICGVNMLNLYNCRELLMLWVQVPRKKRVAKQIHQALFRRLDPQLLSFPFTPESRIKRFLRLHWWAFYLAAFPYAALVTLRSRR